MNPGRRSLDVPHGPRSAFLAIAWVVILAPAVPALAQAPNVALYTDANSSTCSFTGDAPGPVTAYVIVRPGTDGIRGVRFAAPIPPCFGATYVSETVPTDLYYIGWSQTGISIATRFCEFNPLNVLAITYFRDGGSTTPCCEYPIVAEAGVGGLEAVNCANETIVLTGLTSRFNADESCPCAGSSPPDPPFDPHPSNGATLVGVLTALSWDASDFDNDLADYDVYLGTAPNPPLVAAHVPMKTFQPAPLTPLTTHYWRVVARDAQGQETSGPTWQFTTRLVNSPPSVPVAVFPEEFATDVTRAPTLQWYSSDVDNDPLVYDLYFGASSPPPLVATNLPQPSYTTPPLDAVTTYYWRVVVRDGAGDDVSGDEWSFTTRGENNPPIAPFGPNPPNGSTNVSTATTLTWNCSDPDGDAVKYDVYFGAGAGAPPLVVTNLATRSYAPGTLQFSMIYRWRIVARDAYGAETSGPEWSFSTRSSNNLPPTTPSNPNPPDNGTSNSLTPLLTWTSSDPEGGPVSFVIFFGTSYPPPLHGFSSTASYAPGTLQSYVRYYWQVGASDGYLASYGPVWSFVAYGGELPVLFSSFEAEPRDAGVEIRWELSSDEAMDRYTLYRREGTASTALTIVEGPVEAARGSFLDRTVEPATTYHYELSIRTVSGDVFRSPVATATTAVLRLALHQNHPNPFNPQTAIRYDLPGGPGVVRVRLFILDVAGRVVRTLVDEDQGGGSREVIWNGTDERGGTVSSGVYFYVLDAGGERQTRKLVLLK